MLALGQQAVAPDVAALGADDHVDGVALTRELRILRCGGRVDAGEAARAELEAGAVAELDLELALDDDVELLLALVEVKPPSRRLRAARSR